MNDFENWWYHIGSGIKPIKNEDNEEHTKRVCSLFYAYITSECENCAAYPDHKKGISEYCKICTAKIID